MSTQAPSFDLAIVGSGFAGSLLAMVARRLGRSVVLLERGRHPRFQIGESSTPLANLLLEELAQRYNLPALLPLTKWGSWQQSYPQLACGLKRGFSFYAHTLDATVDLTDRRRQLLVAASPHDAIADTHWYRQDLDHFLVRQARELGVEVLEEVTLEAPTWGEQVELQGRHGTKPLKLQARFLVDATGPRGYLHRALNLPELPFPHFPATQALYSHFRHVRRLADLAPMPGTPYPADAAAVHHLFPGGWIWVLHFGNGITSAGVAIVDALAQELNLAAGAPAWHRLLHRLPAVAAQFAGAEPTRPFVHVPRLPFRSGTLTGDRWALLPSAAGFIDPLLSTGIPLTLLGVHRLAELFERAGPSLPSPDPLATYAQHTEQELLTAADLLAALYTHLDDFELFAALSRLYFAAASFTETARRLGRPHLAEGFLLPNHPHFGPSLRTCLRQALTPLTPKARTQLLHQINETIEPIDVAGLTNPTRHGWYPCLASDLLHAAPKLGATEVEIRQLLVRSGFNAATEP